VIRSQETRPPHEALKHGGTLRPMTMRDQRSARVHQSRRYWIRPRILNLTSEGCLSGPDQLCRCRAPRSRSPRAGRTKTASQYEEQMKGHCWNLAAAARDDHSRRILFVDQSVAAEAVRWSWMLKKLAKTAQETWDRGLSFVTSFSITSYFVLLNSGLSS